jgi:hypothetical protein
MWSFFSPEYLFVFGDSSLINSTRAIGLFAIAFAILLPIGLYRIAAGRGGALGWMCAAGLLTAPLAAIISGGIEMNRVQFVVPFAVLVATFGVQALLTAPVRAYRVVAGVLLLTAALQFFGFYADYMGRYRDAASRWFGGDIRAALTEAIDRGGDGDAILLQRGIPFIDRYWRFYALAHGRRDVVGRETLFEWADLDRQALPDDAVLVCAASEATCAGLAADGRWRLVRSVTEPDGTVTFSVFERP